MVLGSPLRGPCLQVVWLLSLSLSASGCSIRTMAVNSLADSLAEGAGVYASDDDPDLVRDALPFALKTFEGLLEEQPEHAELLLATCTGFTQYANAFVEGDALYVEETDWETAEALEQRAVRLYLRARDYCLRGLELESPGIGSRLRLDPVAAADGVGAGAVPLLFWTGASWGSAIALSLDRPELIVDAPAVRVLIERALELDEDWQYGSLHEAMIALESLPQAMGGSPERARDHFERAVELSDGKSAGAYMALTHLTIAEGDRREFERLLEAVLALDPDDRPEARLATILAQRRAQWMLERTDEYFLDDLGEDEGAQK